MARLTILIPAAGASARMGGTDKLLTAIDGVPLLARTARTALAACPDVLITLRPQDDARRAAVAGLALRIVTVADAATGLSASLRAGAAAAPGALMVLPADMPDLTAHDLRLLIEAAGQTAPQPILRATAADGTPGHPVLFPADLLPDFAQLTGDEGARSILQASKARVRLIALPGSHALTDLDTPEAWAAWHAARGNDAP